MYLLAANYLGFYGLAVELGLDPGRSRAGWPGRRPPYLHTDAELWRSPGGPASWTSPRAHGPPSRRVRTALDATPQGATWWAEFEAFLAVWGQRTDETCTIDRPSWAEHPATPLASIREFLAKPEGHDFAAAPPRVLAERDRLVDEARATLDRGRAGSGSTQALASNRSANFVWWNEEHNFLIDRRIHLPVRPSTLAVADRLVAEGASTLARTSSSSSARAVRRMQGRRLGADSRARRPPGATTTTHWRPGQRLPPVWGPCPDGGPRPAHDRALRADPEYFATIRRRARRRRAERLPGRARPVVGTARVLRAAQDIDQVRDGDILVCGGTTTEWTPVFGIIVGLRHRHRRHPGHTAIITREYGIPCVVGTGVATSTISTGDRVRIDGDRGIVEVLA